MANIQQNQIIQGDALQRLAELTTNSIDLIVTDPPYLVGYRDRHNRTIANDRNPDGVLPAFEHMGRVLRDNRYLILFCGWSAIDLFSQAWTEAGFRSVGQILWRKPYVSSTWHTQCCHESAWLLVKGRPAKPKAPVHDVLDWVYSGNRFHPTEKAVDILTPLIRAYSLPGATVLDPFSGSGSTSVAAALCGRNSIGIELEERYCSYARRRLTGVQRYQHRYVAA